MALSNLGLEEDEVEVAQVGSTETTAGIASGIKELAEFLPKALQRKDLDGLFSMSVR